MEFLALAIGYLWGSTPTAYLVAWKVTGKHGELGDGNIGGLNTLRRIGLKAGLAVAGIDVTKGAAAVLTARYILDVETAFVLGAGVMAVVGHNWMVWLGFRGGKGMAAAVGAIGATSFIYGFPVVILALMGIILGVWLITRNLVLGNAVSLLLLPLSVWLVTDSTMAAWLAAVLLGVIVVKYIPDGVADYKRRGLEGLGRDDLNPKM